jgi:hypothetical protein
VRPPAGCGSDLLHRGTIRLTQHGEFVRALGTGAQDDGLGFGEFRHGVPLSVVGGKEGCDTRHEIVVAILIGPEDHIAIVGLHIRDLAQ